MSRSIGRIHSHCTTTLALFGAACLTVAAPGGAQLVIHEIMQNPAAVADSAGEWFEIHNPGPAAADIQGWTIRDDGSDSHTINNGGPLIVPAGGYVVLGNNADPSTNGGVNVDYVYGGSWFLANGDDEVILIDGGGLEVDRVEYDGGPSFPDPTGASMALRAPALDNNLGASWCESSTPFGAGDLGTPGEANDCVPVEEPVELVIHEIMQNPSAVADADGEWFELYNPGADAIDIDGWTIQDNDSDSHLIDNGGPLVVAAGGFVVLASNADAGTNGGVTVDYEYSSFILANGADEVVLLDAALNEIDRVEYDGGPNFPDPTGATMALRDPALDNNLGASWCESRTPFGAGDLGTPGEANDCVPVEPVEMVIHEIMQNPSAVADADGEWFELFNPGGDAVDIDGWTIQDNDSDSHVIDNGGPLVVAAGGYVVLAASADSATNGGVPVDYAYSAFFLANGADEIVLVDTAGNEIDRVEWDNGATFPDPNGASMALRDPLLDNNVGENWCEARTPYGDGDLGSPGAANDCLPIGAFELEIFEIQGTGARSPYEGSTALTTNNVVTAVAPNGFYLQTPESRADADPDTSNGIFVFTGTPPTVAVGDLVDVQGTVAEFPSFRTNPMTELSGVMVDLVSSGSALPAPIAFDSATPSPDPGAPSCSLELECFEGMRIDVAAGTITGPSQGFGTDPIAEAWITATVGPGGEPARTFREPGIEFPGVPGLPLWDGNPEVFELDPDGLGLPNVALAAPSTFSASGVLAVEFDGYELHPDSLSLGAPPLLPVPVRPADFAELTVGSLNLLRLFSTNSGYDIQRDKLAAHIVEVLRAPDILAVQEVNSIVELEDLAAAIAVYAPTVQYSAWLEEGNDIGGIDIGFLTRQTILVDAVTQLGKNEILDFDGSLLHDRPPLLLEGRCIAEGTDFPISVLAVHNRSLSNIETERTQAKRLAQAESIATMVQSLQSVDPGVRLVVTGDFNAFEFSDGYVDVVGRIAGDFVEADDLADGPDLVDPDLTKETLFLDPEDRYSFNFVGNAQALDHALTSSALAPLVTGFEIGRGNSDAPAILAEDGTTVLSSSDHDGIVLYVIKDSDRDGVPDPDDLCPATEIPEGVPTQDLGVNRWALIDGDFEFDTTPSQGNGPNASFTTEDTAGCSCEQIIDELGLGQGHEQFGCSTGVMGSWVSSVSD